MFATLSDRLADTFKHLRGKGKLSEADIDATAREIRIALLEADVALPVVKAFIGNVKERARGAEVSQALNPAQQVIKIVNEELVAILGGETRLLRYAKTAPTVIMLEPSVKTDRSMPAEKCLPVDEMTMQRARALSLMSATMAGSSCQKARFMALSLSGRFSLMCATWSAI